MLQHRLPVYCSHFLGPMQEAQKMVDLTAKGEGAVRKGDWLFPCCFYFSPEGCL